MISPKTQIQKLRGFVIKELEIRTVKKRMIAVLRNKKQYASGNLQSVIEKMKYEKSIRVTNKEFDKLTGFMYKATVEFRFNFQEKGDDKQRQGTYAKFLDEVPYSDIPHKSKRKGIDALIEWIIEKDRSTWKTQVDTSDPKKVKRLAHAIFRSQKNNGRLENRSRFITFTRSNITTAINKASESFVNYLSDKLYLELKSQIFYR